MVRPQQVGDSRSIPEPFASAESALQLCRDVPVVALIRVAEQDHVAVGERINLGEHRTAIETGARLHEVQVRVVDVANSIREQ